MKKQITLISKLLICLFFINNYVTAQNNTLHFDGANDYVTIPHNAALKPATNITLEAWVFANNIPSVNGTYADIIRKEDGGGGRYLFSFQREFGITYLSFGLVVGGTYSELDVVINPSDYLNRWVHIAAVYDGTQKNIYRNGILIGTQTVSGAIGTTGTAPLILGAESGVVSFFNGRMDEFRFWNVARTQAQIQSGMTESLTGTETGLVAYYDFNQGAPAGNNSGVTTVNDLATTLGGSNNGTLTNFALSGTTSNWIGGKGFISKVRGNALSLNGTDQDVECPIIPEIVGASKVTYECWFKVVGTWKDFAMIMSSAQNVNTGGKVHLVLSGGTQGGSNDLLVVVSENQSINNANYNTNSDIIQLNTWYHVAMVFDGTLAGDANRLKLFVNGVQQTGLVYAGSGVVPATTAASAQPFYIGSRYNDLYFNGQMDEVRVWNTARTQNQIRDKMHITLNGTETGLVRYYQFNETTGSVIDPIASNNGTIRNGATRTASTVSVSGGTSARLNVNATGVYNFTGTNCALNFTGTVPNGEVVVSKLEGTMVGTLPSGTNTHTNNYWVINNYGTNTGLTVSPQFTLGAGFISAADAAAPSNLKLNKRNTNSAGGFTQIDATAANVGDANSSDVTFSTINSFSEFGISTTGNSILPIKLLSFTGQLQNNKSILQWQIANPENGTQYELQRSTNGQYFEAINTQIGSASNTNFSYADDNLLLDKYFYKLKIINANANVQYSQVVLLQKANGKLQIQIYPNPVQNNQVNISVSNGKILGWSLLTIDGKTTVSQKINTSPAQTQLITLPAVKTGLYILKVQTNNGIVYEKLTIQ